MQSFRQSSVYKAETAKKTKKEESLSVDDEKILWDRESKLDLKEVGLEPEPTITCRTKLFLGQRPGDITSLEASQNTRFWIADREHDKTE